MGVNDSSKSKVSTLGWVGQHEHAHTSNGVQVTKFMSQANMSVAGRRNPAEAAEEAGKRGPGRRGRPPEGPAGGPGGRAREGPRVRTELKPCPQQDTTANSAPI